MPTPARIPIQFYEGNPYSRTYLWTDDVGSVLWSSGATHKVNDVVRAFPDIVDGFGNRKYFRCTSITTGISGASQPAFSTLAIGQTIGDSGVTWTCESDSTLPIDLSGGSTASLWITQFPDSIEVPTLKLATGGLGIVLATPTVNTIAVSFTQAQVNAVIAALPYAYYDLRVTPPSGVQQTAFFGPIEFQRMAGGAAVRL